ncbi:MAG: hypothetical protein WD738_11990 [Pirellulales bacterium]
MIKPYWYSTRLQENGDTVPHNHRLRMIDLKSMAADELDGERVKWRTAIQSSKKLIEVFESHTAILPL